MGAVGHRNERAICSRHCGPGHAAPAHAGGAPGRGLTTVGDFDVAAGRQVPFVLTYASHFPAAEIDPEEALTRRRILASWASAAATPSSGRRRDAIADHAEGADLCPDRRYRCRADDLAARADRRAAQLGLPLLLAARRHLTLPRADEHGYYDEARAWRDWLLRAAAGSPATSRSCTGSRASAGCRSWSCPGCRLRELETRCALATPLHEQLQLDVYGEVMDALHQARVGGLQPSRGCWDFQRALLAHLETVWREPDEGIWEVRGAASALHLFEGDGLGGVRPRRQDGRGARARRAGRPMAPDRARDP